MHLYNIKFMALLINKLIKIKAKKILKFVCNI